MTDLGLDNSFSNYEVVTSRNLGTAKWQGFELGMRQRLRDFPFVPQVLQQVEIWAYFGPEQSTGQASWRGSPNMACPILESWTTARVTSRLSTTSRRQTMILRLVSQICG